MQCSNGEYSIGMANTMTLVDIKTSIERRLVGDYHPFGVPVEPEV